MAHRAWPSSQPRAAVNPSDSAVLRRCYLCRERRPEQETEVIRHVVPSSQRGGTIQGVNRYVRICKVGNGCKALECPECGKQFTDHQEFVEHVKASEW